jgi:3-methyladenine DNA glycosylase/8-oxoguanine DNA glycosylase
LTSQFTLATPADFRFLPTVWSHGWCRLPPFTCADDPLWLGRTQKLYDGQIIHFEVREAKNGDDLLVYSPAPLTPEQQDEIGSVIACCLSFDHTLQPFHDLVRAHPAYSWIAEVGAGRMLRSPTVWEDLAKTLLTTNTTWAMTIGMVTRLAALGDPAPDGGNAFPTPEQIAGIDPDSLNQKVRAGYRGAYLHQLASEIASGQLDVEAWRDPALSSADVYKALKRIKGYGDYAAGAMMRLLGRFDQLGLDSVCRASYAQRYNGGVPASDKEIAVYYAPFGEWRGLVVWLDVMREDIAGGS